MRTSVAVVLALLIAAAAPGVARAADWVGLGDSYAAGPLIPSQSLNPLGCLRSSRNFAHIAAANRGMSLADVSPGLFPATYTLPALSTTIENAMSMPFPGPL